MLSFELSVIDIVLVVAIIVILLLQMKKAPAESPTERELSGEKRKPLEALKKSLMTRKPSLKKESTTNTPESSGDCPYHFGYLKTLPLGSSVPEKCLSCSRMRQCLFPKERGSMHLKQEKQI